MTMMTPLGRGGPMYPQPRRWPKVLAVILVIAVLGGIGYGVWWWLNQDDDEQTPAVTPTNSCTPRPIKLPKQIPPPRQVRVEVNNGTDESGLAVDTADKLTARGFDVVEVGNTDKPVKSGAAIVRYEEAKLADAVRLASYVDSAELLEVKQIANGNVDLWIGPDFDGVVPTSAASLDSVTAPVSNEWCKGKSKTKKS